jgi:hypothetical protein
MEGVLVGVWDFASGHILLKDQGVESVQGMETISLDEY